MRRHLTRDELNEKYRIAAVIEEECRKQRESFVLDEQITAAIKATHLADMVLQSIVLIDHYGADKEWMHDYLALQKELLQQYDDGTVQLKQMMEHIKLKIGVDIDAYSKSCMVLAGLKKKEEENNG